MSSNIHLVRSALKPDSPINRGAIAAYASDSRWDVNEGFRVGHLAIDFDNRVRLPPTAAQQTALAKVLLPYRSRVSAVFLPGKKRRDTTEITAPRLA